MSYSKNMIENIQIRTATLNDLNQLLIWGRKLYEVEKQFEPLMIFSETEARERYTRQIDDQTCLFLIVQYGTQPVGYLYAHLDKVSHLETDRKECYLEVIYLEPQARGKQISSLLIKKCFEWATSNNALRIRSDIFAKNHASVGTFEKNGFSLTNVVYSRKI